MGKGYAPIDVVSTFFKVATTMTGLAEAVQMEFVRIIGKTHHRMLEGAPSVLQVLVTGGSFFNTYHHLFPTACRNDLIDVSAADVSVEYNDRNVV